MTVKDLVFHPSPILREKSVEILEFNSDLAKLADDMIETMFDANGIGLAGIQVGVAKRILVLGIPESMELNAEEPDDQGEKTDEELDQNIEEEIIETEVYINPKILKSSGEISYEEGCLSIPGVRYNVKRPDTITVEYQDLKGDVYEMETSGLRAIALQHEIDHLNGVLFTDHLSPLTRSRLLAKYLLSKK